MAANDAEAFWTVMISSSQSDFTPSRHSRSAVARIRIPASQNTSGALPGRKSGFVRSVETRMSFSEADVSVKSMKGAEICQEREILLSGVFTITPVVAPGSLRDRHEEQGALGIAGDSRGDAAGPEGIHSSLPMRGHDDQVGAVALRGASDGFGRVAPADFGGDGVAAGLLALDVTGQVRLGFLARDFQHGARGTRKEQADGGIAARQAAARSDDEDEMYLAPARSGEFSRHRQRLLVRCVAVERHQQAAAGEWRLSVVRRDEQDRRGAAADDPLGDVAEQQIP